MKIGIWLDYGGQTLSPAEGIGVFVSNLVRGLLEQPERLEFVLLAHPGDHEVLEPLRLLAPQRIRVVPGPDVERPGLAQRMASAWLTATARLRAPLDHLRAWRTRRRQQLAGFAASLLQRVRRGDPLALAAVVLAAPAAAVAAWAVYTGMQLAGAAWRTLTLPLKCADRLARRLQPPPPVPLAPPQIVHSSGCDVWVLPYLGVIHALDFPSVLFIHDLVVHHFPEAFPPNVVAGAMRAARERAAEATLCATMSAVIKEVDLIGVLGLPEERIRVVRPVPPADLPLVSGAQAAAMLPPALARPYLFYPGALRGYKNHAMLLRALAVLRDEHGDESLDVVFTGPDPNYGPGPLLALAERLGLTSRVHVLGRVDRTTLAALYRCALATVVPSLYEQGSFPIYEALHLGCPVACSDIPALHEQFEGMGEAMIYFDPHDPRAVARTIQDIRARRDEIRLCQLASGKVAFQRTWKDVAGQWLTVFREAAELGRRQVAAPRRAA
jgi:glycosyltransferase involved in cell wall biosynthesis